MNALEQWCPIGEFPDYAISDQGRVKRTVRRGTSLAGRILKLNTIHGYSYIGLSKDGKVFSRRVNRLVCRAFHGEPPTPEHHAAHNDGAKSRNTAGNLRWATRSENMMDKHAHGSMPMGDSNGARLYPERLARGARNGKHTKPECTPRGVSHPAARLNNADVAAIRIDTRSRRQIAAAYGVSKCAIDGVKTGKTWSHVQ